MKTEFVCTIRDHDLFKLWWPWYERCDVSKVATGGFADGRAKIWLQTWVVQCGVSRNCLECTDMYCKVLSLIISYYYYSNYFLLLFTIIYCSYHFLFYRLGPFSVGGFQSMEKMGFHKFDDDQTTVRAAPYGALYDRPWWLTPKGHGHQSHHRWCCLAAPLTLT